MKITLFHLRISQLEYTIPILIKANLLIEELEIKTRICQKILK